MTVVSNRAAICNNEGIPIRYLSMTATPHTADFTQIPLSRRARNKRIAEERTRMAAAPDYATWYQHACTLDVLEGMEAWKLNPVSPHYEHELIESRLSNLKTWRRAKDWGQIIFSLREGMQRNLANLANPELYKHTHVGTKRVIDDYITLVAELLNHLCDHDIADLPHADKPVFFKQTGHGFGRSALLLSGGANMGLFHVGVVKALWERDLLPRVVSGSSAGSMVAGLLGTRTDNELPKFFSGENVDLHAWRWLGLGDMWRQKSIMDNSQLELCLRRNIGEYTFEEAYKRTRRIINITVSPVGLNHQPRLLNYLTTPHIAVWSGVMASCAVPGLFPPVTLMSKDRNGEYRPYMPAVKWADGSLKSDLPMRRLAELYNVNHHIVSQTNPHVLPFIADTRRKEGWTSFLAGLVRGEMKYRSRQILQLTSFGLDSGMLKQVLSHAAAMVEQNYYGDVTIHPDVELRHYVTLLTNLSHDEFRRRVLEGERATWPKIAMIRDQTVIGQTLEECIQRLKRHRRAPPHAA